MKNWWRKALVAGLILLFATSGALFLRLDPDKLSTSVQSQWRQWSGQKIRIGSASLSLLQGISLRIQNVDVQSKKQGWHLHADGVRLGLSVWHLLQGETGIKSAEIIHPVLDFSNPPQMKYLVGISLPKSLNQLHIRQGRIRINSRPIAQGFDGTVRRISRDQELTWELQTSLFGGDLTTQGRIQPAEQENMVFGKLDAKHIHLKDLSAFSPEINPPQPAYDTFGTSLTFDVNAGKEWNLFGDSNLHASLKNTPAIIWRGKVDGAGWQRLNWHDAFLQMGRNTMFSTTGGCVRDKGCHFDINTRKAEIPLILNALNLNLPVKGTLNAKSSFSWKNGQWSARGDLASHHVSWSDIPVPDATVSMPNAHYHAPGHIELAGVHLQVGDEGGSMVLGKFTKSAEKWNLDAHARNMAHAWAPFANILLKYHGIKPDLKGKGTLGADVEVSHDVGHTGIDFSIHTDQAQIAYSEVFSKPASIPASITAHADMEGNRNLLTIQNAELGDDYIKRMQWVIGQKKTECVSAEDIHIDLTKLRQSGVVLPDGLKDWHGAIHGHFAHLRPSARTNMPDWFAESDAKLELADFGVGEHQWNGLINIRNGTLSTRNLLWKTIDQRARLAGVFSLSSGQGNMNVQDATLSWNQGDALPAWLSQAKLHGHFHNIDLDWMGNTWGKLDGLYRTKGQHITLKKVRGKLAGGSIQSPELSLALSPQEGELRLRKTKSRVGGRGSPGGSVHFSGPVRMAIVRLGKLHGLSEALGANLDGYIYLNANLDGEFPWYAQSAWKGNGDIEIQHGHWQPVDKKLTIAAGDLHTETGKTLSFSRFTTRFHLGHRALKFTRMQLETGTKQITGNGFLHPNGEIGGNLQIRDEHGSRKSELIGNWPEVSGLFGSK